MEHSLNINTIKLFVKEHLSLMITLAVVPVLCLLVYVSVNKYFTNKDEIDQLHQEVDDLNAQVTILKNDKTLLDPDIEDFNQMLSQLIPETEDFFSIVYTLEKISQETGFIIVSYVIDLPNSNKEKISLTVEGQGDTDLFLHFLEQYKYIGGRLVTSEKMEFSPDVSGSIRVNLNFYNKKKPPGTRELSEVKAKDVELMRQIRAKTTILVKEDQNLVEPYPTKNNPFKR